MYIRSSVGLIIICLFLGCSVFNKNKSTADSSTTPTVTTQDTEGNTAVPEINNETNEVVVEDSIPPPPKAPLEYMTIEEKAMVEEINLLRADPNAYIQYVDAYLQDFMEDENWDFATKQAEKSAGDDLIRQLRYLAPLELLEPSEELYKVAVRHGKDMKENDMITHRGSDNSMPEDRIRDSTALLGSENLAAGGRSVRESVIMLLVDANDRANKSHRKAILNPLWKYGACYYVGTVAEIPGTWVQLFGYTDPDDIPEDTSTPDDITSTGSEETGNPSASGNFSFMSEEEKAMIDEINLMRSNPKGYIQYVEEYVKERKKVEAFPSPDLDVATNELKGLLRSMSKLSTLKPHKKLYEVTKAHGLDNKNNNQLEHTGSDGRSSFKRIKDSGLKNSITWTNGSGNYAPNENLVGGEPTVRNAVIALLIDADLPQRGHRKALIEPAWEYVACYQIGKIENLKDLMGMGLEDPSMKNCWVQFFGKGPDSNAGANDTASNSNSETGARPKRSLPKTKKDDEIVSSSGSEKPESNPESENENNSEKTSSSASGDFAFMSQEEKAMIDEINLMRSNPKGYIKYVDAYVKELKKVLLGPPDPDLDVATNELKGLLRTMPKLSTLKPHKKLYEVTKAHGLDNKNNNQLEHTGSDGRSNFKRIKDSGLKNSITWSNGSGNYAPNENLVGGEATVRNAVISLLIDEGISTRGHRKALIEPTWEYVACYKVGTIENLKELRGSDNPDMKNCWIQFFAIE